LAKAIGWAWLYHPILVGVKLICTINFKIMRMMTVQRTVVVVTVVAEEELVVMAVVVARVPLKRKRISDNANLCVISCLALIRWKM